MAYIAQKIVRKTPAERVPLTFDFGGAGELPAGETLEGGSVTATITPDGELIEQSVGLTDTSVTVWVTGGVAGVDYEVDVVVTTAPSAVILAISGRVQVRER